MSAAAKGAATTCKEAITRWRQAQQAKNLPDDEKAAKKVSLICQAPSIKKMDPSLSTLIACEHLSLSTNQIDQIRPLNLKYLRILSLGRNNIKRIEKLDDLHSSLEELWISYNSIERLDGLSALKKLRVLYISNNNIKSFDELYKLKDTAIADLMLVGNPIYTDLTVEQRRLEVVRRLPKLEKLDGVVVSGEEREKVSSFKLEEKKEHKEA